MSAVGAGSTARIADFVAAIRYEDLPASVAHDTKRIIADTIACALGATSMVAGQIIISTAHELGQSPRAATVIGSRRRASAAACAFANSYLANLLDGDETLLNSTHHACCTVFPALALCEAQAAHGKELIAAVAAGYDIGARIGLSLTIASINVNGDVQRVPTAGLGWAIFAAASAGGRAMRLTAAEIAHALGIAGWVSPISCHRKWDETRELHMMKNSPHGFMGMHGVMAAQMAQAGMQADTSILDGEAGYWALAGSPDCNWAVLTGALGEKWWISEAAVKPYAINRLEHHSIDAFRKIVRNYRLQPDEISSVCVKTFARVASPFLSGTAAPETPIAAQFSLPFALAACAYGIELTPHWQSAEVLNDVRLRSFTQRIRVETDPAIQRLMAEDFRRTRRYPRVPATVIVTARGTSYSASTEYAWGDPGTKETRMTDEELKAKFMEYTAAVMMPKRAAALLDALFNLEDISSITKEIPPLLRTIVRPRS